ncbi:MAG: excinuclease ABC subunit UvrC [Gammaproteobacteria bacterium]|nr:excinuclease ABC subunit UvrC [Gammaproteobacteria bacterium]
MTKFDSQVFLRSLTHRPGVYLMFDQHQKILYIGKAKDLKKRVSSYFTRVTEDAKTRALVQLIANIETIVTQPENEALILENQLIKQYQPRYNVSLKDDKGYPFIFLSSHDFPRIAIQRGPQKEEGVRYGPFSSVAAVFETIELVKKVFRLRSCKDSFFASRTRPCLQYQIHRCTAPCVNYISKEEYAATVQHAKLFLEGKSEEVVEALMQRMERASDRLDYEAAMQYRDQIRSIRQVQSKQFVSTRKGNVDIVVALKKYGFVCISLMMIRQGKLLGYKVFTPNDSENLNESDVLTAFLGQYYLCDCTDFPAYIILNHDVQDRALFESVLTDKASKKVRLQLRVKGQKAKWLHMALNNAFETLQRRALVKSRLHDRFIDLQNKLRLPEMPKLIECFDISHMHGEETVASCVAFGVEGPIKSAYRIFNITGITPGDDYAAMKQALSRHFKKALKEKLSLPDVLIVDGGKGQLKQAEEVLRELGVESVFVLGIAKGPSRKPGVESIFLSSHSVPFDINVYSPAFHLIQQLRDEAHRFAITAHRKRKGKIKSLLEEVPGVGVEKRKVLLKHFGGMQGVMSAGILDLQNVPGISSGLAKAIYEYLHGIKT